MHFKDRQDAAKQLAHALKKYAGKDVIVYALPRGGVVLSVEVAKTLSAKLDLLIPRKIGHPYNPEYAIAAVTEHGSITASEHEISHVDPAWLARAVTLARQEAKRRRMLYLKNRKPITTNGKTAIIVDDGLATGLTMKAAIQELKRQKPKRIVVAVPVAPTSTVAELAQLVDDMIVLYVPAGFLDAIGSYYQNFDQVSDEMVIGLINSLT